MKTPHLLITIVSGGALLLASTALACPLCQLGSSGFLRAYLGPTMLLSLLPLGMAGGIAFWLKRAGARARAHPMDHSQPR